MARGLILLKMRILLTALFLALPFAAAAQDLPAPEPVPVPQLETDRLQVVPLPIPEAPIPEADGADSDVGEIEGEDIVPEDLAPDYSKLSPKAERIARLDDLFVKLAEREEEESANLVAEEIMAIWTESGSASVNLLLRRGSEATAQGDPKLARKMYNHAVDLAPDYTEAWARSARLALTQKQYNRALNESLKTLTLEPRHFYTLWTLGNVFEVLNRPDDALETYREANRLYPELKAVKDRLKALEVEVEGTVL